MPPTPTPRRRATARDLAFLQTPERWPRYPFLPLVRCLGDRTLPECGLLYDALGVSGRVGYRCTVFLVNLLAVPTTEAALLAAPRRVYDTFDELADDGWVVD
jgi:hypothetical protein